MSYRHVMIIEMACFGFLINQDMVFILSVFFYCLDLFCFLKMWLDTCMDPIV